MIIRIVDKENGSFDCLVLELDALDLMRLSMVFEDYIFRERQENLTREAKAIRKMVNRILKCAKSVGEEHGKEGSWLEPGQGNDSDAL